MKLLLGLIVRNEAAMLSRTLSVMRSHFDGAVAIDARSTDDTIKVLATFRVIAEARPWTNSYAAARNACIALAERFFEPPAHMLMLDADEALLPRDILPLRAAIVSHPAAYALPRYEFVDDFVHFNPAFYPDYQARCFPLYRAYTYTGAIHEQLAPHDFIPLPYTPIFHYGKCKPIAEVALKYENYNRFARGEPPLERLPEGYALPATFSHGPRLRFCGDTPL